jgi:hypothetical protein
LINFQLLPWRVANASNSSSSNSSASGGAGGLPNMNSNSSSSIFSGGTLSVAEITTLIQAQVSNPNSTLNQVLPPGSLDTSFVPQIEVKIQCWDGQWRVTCPAKPTTAPPTVAPTEALATPTQPPSSSSLSMGVIIGIAVGGFVVLGGAIFGMYKCFECKKAAASGILLTDSSSSSGGGAAELSVLPSTISTKGSIYGRASISSLLPPEVTLDLKSRLASSQKTSGPYVIGSEWSTLDDKNVV